MQARAARRFLGTARALVPVLAIFASHAYADGLDDERSARMKDALESADPVVALGGYARAHALFAHVAVPGALAAFDDDVAAHAHDAGTRTAAAFALVRRTAESGDVDGASARAAALGFVTHARALGPFSNTGGGAFGTPIADAARAGSTDKVAGLEREVGWQTVPMEPTGELDLVPRISPTKETRALVAVVVSVPAAAPAVLRVATSGQVRATLNGAEVLRADVDRFLGFDQNVAGVVLQKGDNLLVVEAGFLGDDATVRLRFTRPDGGAVPGVTFLVDDAAFARAAKTKPSAVAAPAVVDVVALAHAVVADGHRRSAVRAAADVEELVHAGDLRSKPLDVERALEAVIAADDESTPPSGRSAFDLAEAHARLGGVERSRDISRARREYDAALAFDPRCVEALLGLASLRAELDDPRAARALLLRAQAVAPSSDLVVRRVLESERGEGNGGIATDLAIVARADAAPTAGNLDLAADVLDERGDRASALVLAKRANDSARVNRLASEMAAARAGSDATALEERVVLAKAALHARLGNHAQAEALAIALVSAGHVDEARAFAVDRARAFPEREEPVALAARLALMRGDRNEARAQIVAALAIRPQDAELQRTLRSLSTSTSTGDGGEELVARYALDPAAFAHDPIPPDALRIGAHVVASTVAIRFFENGLGRIVTDRLVRVHDAKKAEGLSTMSFPYSEGRETLEILTAERITKEGRHEPAMRVVDNGPGGRENGVYTDVSVKTVVLGQLKDGDLVHVRTRKELVGMQNLFGDFFGDLEPIQSVVPTRHFRLVVEAPLTRQLAWGGKNAPAPKIHEEKDRRIYDFTVEEAKAVEPEPGMPPFLEDADFVSVSTYASWAAMGAWYERMASPQWALDDELKKIAKDIATTSKDEEDKVRRIYDHVVTSTRYVGIELGIHGWKPYPVTEVHRRRYGDCKDKASLLVALLREAGVPANIVLVRTANLGDIADFPPSMWTFNHAIAYVPSLNLFLDGTAETSGFRETPPLDQGAQVLIVGKHGDKSESELTHIPMQAADANLNVSDYVLHLDTDGTLRLHGTEKFRGSHNAEERHQLADPTNRRQLLEKQLAEVMPGTHVENLQPSSLSLDVDEISYTFDAELPDRAVKETGALSMAVSLYPHDLSGNYAEQSQRKTDIFVEHPWRTRNVMRYVMPAGYTVELPSGGTVQSKYVAFTQKITKTADGFIVDEDTAVLARRIPVADYASFRDACLKADALMKRKLRIVKAP